MNKKFDYGNLRNSPVPQHHVVKENSDNTAIFYKRLKYFVRLCPISLKTNRFQTIFLLKI